MFIFCSKVENLVKTSSLNSATFDSTSLAFYALQFPCDILPLYLLPLNLSRRCIYHVNIADVKKAQYFTKLESYFCTFFIFKSLVIYAVFLRIGGST